MERNSRAKIFRARLMAVMERSGLSQAAFAKSIQVDRSSLFQLLEPEAGRLPRVETLVAIATVGRVSLDWLMGLETLAVPPEVVKIEPDAASPVDERLMTWHREAAGYKIRHVPLTFPDLLKTDAVIDFEYRTAPARDFDGVPPDVGSRLASLRQPDIDFEASTSVQSLTAFARGEGVWQGLEAGHRREQLDWLASLCDELFPTFRWSLFDERQVSSVPLTVFGPHRAALYTGRDYLVFEARDHVQALARHFDGLVRSAVVQPHEIARHLSGLTLDLLEAA